MARQEPPRKMRKTADDNNLHVKTGTIDVQSNWLKIFEAQEVETGHFDVTFVNDGRELLAHKFILSSNSKVFHAMFTNNLSINDGVVKVESFSYDNFKSFLTCFYSGRYSINKENVKTMVDMAEFYDVPELKGACDEYIMSRTFKLHEAVEMFAFAKKYVLEKSFNHLLQFIKGFIQAINYKTSKEDILALAKLETSDEVFKAVFNWSKSKSYQELYFPEVDEVREYMKMELNDIIPHLNVNNFSSLFIQMLLKKHQVLFSKAQLNLMEDAIKFPLIVLSHNDDPCHKLKGRLHVDPEMMEKIQASVFDKIYSYQDHDGYHWSGRCTIPSKPSQINIGGKAPFYFVVDRKKQHFALKNRKDLKHDYLLAEMFGTWDSKLNNNCTLTIVA